LAWCFFGLQVSGQQGVAVKTGYSSFATLSQVVGALALVGLLLFGWITGQQLPLWPALLVVAVNVVLAIRLVLGVMKRRAAAQAQATKAAPPAR
jgi:ABC-type arginine transport system ATPase subunit